MTDLVRRACLSPKASITLQSLLIQTPKAPTAHTPTVGEHLQLDSMTSGLVAQPAHIYNSSFFLSSFYQCFCWTIRISKSSYGRNTILKRKLKQNTDYESMQRVALPLPFSTPASCPLCFTQEAHGDPKGGEQPLSCRAIQSGEYACYSLWGTFLLPWGKHSSSLTFTLSCAQMQYKRHPSLST